MTRIADMKDFEEVFNRACQKSMYEQGKAFHYNPVLDIPAPNCSVYAAREELKRKFRDKNKHKKTWFERWIYKEPPRFERWLERQLSND